MPSEQVLAAFEHLFRERVMRCSRGGDDDGVDLRIVEQGVDVRDDFGTREVGAYVRLALGIDLRNVFNPAAGLR